MRTPFPVVLPLAAALIIVLGDCSREPTPEQRQADSTLTLARTQLDRGEFRSARASLAFALALDLRLNRPQPLAEEYTLLGRLSVLSADFDGALIYLTKAMDQYKSLTDRPHTREVLLEIASLHRQMGEEDVAYNMYSEAVRLSMVFHDIDGAHEIQFEMLPTCRALGHFDEEGELLDTLIKAYGALDRQGMQSRVHFESALSLIQREEYAQAVEPLLRALTMADRAKDSLFVIRVLSTLADAYFRSGNTPLAFETYTDALTRADRTSGAHDIRMETLIRVGNIYLGMSQFSEAGRFYRAALNSAVALGNKLAEGYLFTQLGHCAIGEGLVQQAIASIQHSVDLFGSEGYLPGLAFANASMGIACERTARFNDALHCFTTAVDQMDHCATRAVDVYTECEDAALRKQSFYDLLTELLLKLGRTDEAFWYAERSTEHDLFEKVSDLRVKTRTEGVNLFLSQFRHAQALREGSERQLAKLMVHGPGDKGFREQIRRQIMRSDTLQDDAAGAIVRLNPDMKPAVLFNGAYPADVQRILRPGSVLLRHIPTSQSVYTFAITSSRVNLQLAALGKDRLRSEMTDYVSAFRQIEALADSPSSQRGPLEQLLNERTNQLYGALIRPVESTLAGASEVLVVTVGGLPLIPIHALRKGGGRTPYCIEQFPVVYLPSVALLGRPTAPEGQVHDIVGLGQPGNTAWDVEYELRDIRAFYKDARLYFGQQASLATWQREHGDVLQLALDLQYSARSPGNACALLSDSKTRGVVKERSWGDFLTTPPFPTTIISHLSADSVRLDPLLPSLFLINGSSTVIVNTFPATRKAKKFFGELFYTGLLGGMSAETAFRQAQVEMIRNRDYAAPYFWAPFTLWEE